MTRLTLVLLVLLVLLGPARGRARAQAPPPPPTPGAPAGEAAPTPPPNYEYQPDARRDPFVSLVNRGTDARSPAEGRERPQGLAGLLVDEVVVRGIVKTRDGWIAMVGAPNNRTYTVRPGGRLMDGFIQTITAEAIVLMQDVNDPLSLEKQREVRKFLRGEVK